MPLKVPCGCGRTLNLKDSMAGKRGKCPYCGTVLTIPSADELGAVEVRQYDLDPSAAHVVRSEEQRTGVPDARAAAEKSELQWSVLESAHKMVKQVVLTETKVSRCSSPVGGPFLFAPLMEVRAWGMCSGYSTGDDTPYLFAKCVGIEEVIKDMPCRLAFAFYRFPEAALFQPLLEIRHDATNPFVVENPWNVRSKEMLRIGEDFFSRSSLVIQFFDAQMIGVHARVLRPPPECLAALRSLWEEARAYDRTRPANDFRAAVDRYYRMNPMEQSPILDG